MGSTLTRPRSGDPDGPAGMNRPSKALSTCSISVAVPANRGITSVAANRSTAAASALPVSRSAAEGSQPVACRAATSSRAFASVWSPVARSSVPSSARPSACRRPGIACAPPNSWRARKMASTRSSSCSPVGFCPRMCSPSRIWTSLISHSQPSTCSSMSSNESSSGRSVSPRSWSILAARISVQICWRMAGSLPGSSAATLACSSSNCSKRAMSP
ncbi:Uncharacterised protein [Mycobacterium tuberculosis]|nr:Uncharacterised protein [Mycobacterium tuberculosis]